MRGSRRRSIPRLNMEGVSMELNDANSGGNFGDRSPSDYSPCPGASPTSPWAPAGPPVPPDLWPTAVAPGQQQINIPQQVQPLNIRT